MNAIVIPLGYDSPPLRSNARMHWAPRAELTRQIRAHAGWQSKALCRERGPIDGRVTVTLIWTVTDGRRRDAGASSPTLKAALDGIVDGGLLPDDSSRYVVEERCRIERGTTPGVVVVVEPIEDADSRRPVRAQAGAQRATRESHQCDSPEAPRRSEDGAA